MTPSDAALAPVPERAAADENERLERRLQQLLSSRAGPNSLCAVAPIAALWLADRHVRRSAAHRAAARQTSCSRSAWRAARTASSTKCALTAQYGVWLCC